MSAAPFAIETPLLTPLSPALDRSAARRSMTARLVLRRPFGHAPPLHSASGESDTMGMPLAHRRFTVDEYYRMAEVGILRPDERVELLDGEILLPAPQRAASRSLRAIAA